MLTVLGSPRRSCDGLTRRESLQVGALGSLGLMGLPMLAEGDELPRRQHAGQARSVILLYLLGGAATQDMIDLKPNAPDDVRGEFRPISTSVPGIQICEHLPRTSRWLHKMALVRSLNHRAGCHNPVPSYTGSEQTVIDLVNRKDSDPPSMGSVCEFLRAHGAGRGSPDPAQGSTEGLPSRTGTGDLRSRNRRGQETRAERGDRRGQETRAERQGPEGLPDYVYMPCYLGWGQAIRRPGPYAGFLGQRYDALTTEVAPFKAPGRATGAAGDPAIVLGEPRLPNSLLADGVTIDRLNQRRSLMGQIEDQMRRADAQPSLDHFNRTQRRAFNLLTSTEIRSAFDLESEDPRLRERYGRTLFGNCSLIARRLVERGVRFINVTWDLFWDRVPINYDAWDTHTRNAAILKNVNLPELDQTYSALLQDLYDRGLLEETLVVVMSEMGRTPRLNANAGRDHWTYCYGMWFAGGGIRGGTVVGESDAQAAYVKDRPVSPADVCATIYESLGIDPEMMVPDHRTGRPIAISQGGTAIREIMV